MKISEKAFGRLMDAVALLSILITLLVLCSTFHFGHVPSESMVPTLKVDDVVVINTRAKANRGDIILFYPHADDNVQYVKRLIAVGGDIIAIHDGVVILNGEPLDEPYLNEEMLGEMEEYTVPEGHFFAMGDNRNHSMDSRFLGAFPNDWYIGKVIFKY